MSSEMEGQTNAAVIPFHFRFRFVFFGKFIETSKFHAQPKRNYFYHPVKWIYHISNVQTWLKFELTSNAIRIYGFELEM